MTWTDLAVYGLMLMGLALIGYLLVQAVCAMSQWC